MARAGKRTARLEIDGKPYVLVPGAEYDRLAAKAGILPVLPAPDVRGLWPAVATVKVLIARKIMQRRLDLGLEQKELAKLAGVRAETISRIESGKHRPQQQTVERIDRALTKAESKTAARRKRRA